MFLEIFQNSQENTCARVFCLIKLQTEACNSIKKETLAQVLSCEFAKFLRIPFLTKHLRWLLLNLEHVYMEKKTKSKYSIYARFYCPKLSTMSFMQRKDERGSFFSRKGHFCNPTYWLDNISSFIDNICVFPALKIELFLEEKWAL